MTFSIIRCARAVLHVTDLAASRDFYERVLGFVVTEADREHIYLRGLEEYHHHSLVLKKRRVRRLKHLATKSVPSKNSKRCTNGLRRNS